MAQWSDVWSAPTVKARDRREVIRRRANTPPSPIVKKEGGKYPHKQKAGGRNE